MADEHDRHGIPPEASGWQQPAATEQRRTTSHPEERRKRWRIFSRRAPRGDIGVPGKKFDTRRET